MNKPTSMSLKEWIIKKMAINLVISERIINTIITHQYDSANDALETAETLEISGFGKFTFGVKKAHRIYASLLRLKKTHEDTIADEATSDKRKHSAEHKLASVLVSLRNLKPKIKDDI